MQAQNYSIRSWAKDDQPREKLLFKGPQTLSDSELLAILINHGYAKSSALDIARKVLELGRNNLPSLSKLTVKELMKIKGVGKAKAITIVAAMELGRRRQASDALSKMTVFTSKDIASYVQSLLQDYRHEVFGVVYLNRANRINHFEILSEGGITSTVADPRVILKKALDEDAVNIILCHNHPSGSLKPSRADEDLTLKVKQAAAFFDIKVLDHVIVGEGGFFSFADEGLL